MIGKCGYTYKDNDIPQICYYLQQLLSRGTDYHIQQVQL